MFVCGGGVAYGQELPSLPTVGVNHRINFIVGPDPNNPVDDDDPYDPNDPDQAEIKAQFEPSVGVIRDLPEPRVFAAWTDHSWAEVWTPPYYSNDLTIGFAASSDLHGDSWLMHDLARSPDGLAGDGYLPPPDGDPNQSPGPNQWLQRQANVAVADIRPGSGVTGVHLVGAEVGTVGADEPRRIFYAWSPDGQSNWDVRTVVYIPDEDAAGYFDEMPYVSVWGSQAGRGARYVLVTWTRQRTDGVFHTSWVMYSMSTNGGASFPPAARISDPDPAGAEADSGYATSAFGPDGTAYVVWHQEPTLGAPVQDPNDTNDYIKMRTSTDFGANWYPSLQENGTVVTRFQPATACWLCGDYLKFTVVDRPSVVVDHTCRRAGSVYVCYASTEPAVDPNGFPYDNPDIFVVRSGDGGVTWDDAVRVNNDPLTYAPPYGHPIPTIQFMPWITMDDFGRIGVGFYDRRDDYPPSAEAGCEPLLRYNQRHRYYFAHSIDGGASFEENTPVAEELSDTYVYPWCSDGFPRDRRVGGYTTFAGASNKFFAAWFETSTWNRWSGNRSQIGDIYFAGIQGAVPPDFDWDCDVDGDDFSLFAECYNGANNPPAPSCPPEVNADFDNDCDVDGDDFGIFAACYNRANNPPAGACPWEACGGGGVGGGGQAPMGGDGASGPVGDPTDDADYWELYWMLYEYCQDNGIPFP